PRPGVPGARAGAAPRVLGGRGEPERPTPVVPHDDPVAEVEVADERGDDHGVLGGAVSERCWAFGEAESEVVHGDAAESCAQVPDQVAVEEAPGGVAVQQQHGLSTAFSTVVHPTGRAVEPSGLEGVELW